MNAGRNHPRNSSYLSRLYRRFALPLLFLCIGLAQARAQTATIRIAADHPGHPISPTLYGIFFEDINCSADGGLYAELVRNRNFEDADQPEHWSIHSGGDGKVEAAI